MDSCGFTQKRDHGSESETIRVQGNVEKRNMQHFREEKSSVNESTIKRDIFITFLLTTI